MPQCNINYDKSNKKEIDFVILKSFVLDDVVCTKLKLLYLTVPHLL